MASTPSKRRQLDGVAAWSPHPTHRLICAQVGQSLKLTDRKDIEKEEIIKGRAVCTELFQALKYASSKHHNPDNPVHNLKRLIYNPDSDCATQANLFTPRSGPTPRPMIKNKCTKEADKSEMHLGIKMERFGHAHGMIV